MKLDTFRPNLPIDDPDRFYGRVEPLRSFVNAISQVRVGNPRHIAITGERGVGKSSFLNQAIGIAEGNITLLQRHHLEYGEAFSFKTVRVDATYRYDVPDLCDAFRRRLQSTFGRALNTLREAVSSVDLKVFEVKFESFKDRPIGVEEAFAEFIGEAFERWQRSARGDGLILAIDEIDRVKREAGLGTFFKLLTEILARAGRNRITIVICGQTGAVQDMQKEHESVGRVFYEIPLGTLDEIEVNSIITAGFERAGCLYDETVTKKVLYLSRGLGSRVHLIGSHCLQVDTDDFISDEDLDAARDLMISETLRPELEGVLRLAGGGHYKVILEVMAGISEDVVHIQSIANATGWSQNQFSTNMSNLVKRDILRRTGDGYYTFIDPLLKAYVAKFGAGRISVNNGQTE